MRCIGIERAFRAAGLGVVFSALACGGKTGDESKPAEPSYDAPGANPTSPLQPATTPAPQQSAPKNTPPPSPPEPPVRFREAPPVDLAKAAAENVLQANCGQCHGPALTPAQAQGGINYINDIDKLIVNGLLLPLDSAGSRLIELMRNGTEPPAASGYPPMTNADIDVIASYLDNPRFWPILVPGNSVDAGSEAPSVDAGADGG